MVVTKKKKKTGYTKKKSRWNKKKEEKEKKKKTPCDHYCYHERCHHLKCVKYLQYQKKKFNINFFASLLPYHTIFQQEKYGIIKGMTDFFIDHPLRDKKSGKVIKTSLYVELKVGRGVLTIDEKREIRKILEKGDSVVGVVYGVNNFKTLLKAWRDGKSLEKIEALCWAGRTKKHHVISKK